MAKTATQWLYLLDVSLNPLTSLYLAHHKYINMINNLLFCSCFPNLAFSELLDIGGRDWGWSSCQGSCSARSIGRSARIFFCSTRKLFCSARKLFCSARKHFCSARKHFCLQNFLLGVIYKFSTWRKVERGEVQQLRMAVSQWDSFCGTWEGGFKSLAGTWGGGFNSGE